MDVVNNMHVEDELGLSLFVPFFYFIFIYFFRYGIEGPVYLTPRSEKGGGEWFVDEQQQKNKKMDGS